MRKAGGGAAGGSCPPYSQVEIAIDIAGEHAEHQAPGAGARIGRPPAESDELQGQAPRRRRSGVEMTRARRSEAGRRPARTADRQAGRDLIRRPRAARTTDVVSEALDGAFVVRGHRDGSAGVSSRRDGADDGCPGCAVLADGRLVEQDRGRTVAQGRGQHQPALLPARQVVGARSTRWDSPSTSSSPSARRSAAAESRPHALAEASTSSSTVDRTIPCSGICGTQASASGRSGTASARARNPCRWRDRRRPRHCRSSGRCRPASTAMSVDLPDPLGPVIASASPERISTLTLVECDRLVRIRRRIRPGLKRTVARSVRTAHPLRSISWRRPAVRVEHGGLGEPSTRDPDALSGQGLRPWSARVRRGSPSATTEPSRPSTMSRSAKSSHGSRWCSTITTVGSPPFGEPSYGGSDRLGRLRVEHRGRLVEQQQTRHRGRGFRPGPAAGSRPRTARSSGGRRRTGSPSRPGPSRPAARWRHAGRAWFSRPNATSRPTVCATTAARGSWSSSPIAVGGTRRDRDRRG